MTIHEHNRLLAGFFFIKGALQLAVWMLGGAFFSGGWLTLMFAGFFMFTGWKLQNEQSDAKIFGIVASALCLMSFPIGTALGIYGLWFFLSRANDEY